MIKNIGNRYKLNTGLCIYGYEFKKDQQIFIKVLDISNLLGTNIIDFEIRYDFKSNEEYKTIQNIRFNVPGFNKFFRID